MYYFPFIHYVRQRICYSAYMLSPVRLSVTHWYCVKTKKASVMIYSLFDSPTILVF